MGLFCPNCGSKNETAETPCGSCGFRLAGVTAPKFKGTMMLSSDKAVRELVDAHASRGKAAAPRAQLGNAPPAAASAATMVGAAGVPRPEPNPRRQNLAGGDGEAAPHGVAQEATLRSALPSPVGGAAQPLVGTAEGETEWTTCLGEAETARTSTLGAQSAMVAEEQMPQPGGAAPPLAGQGHPNAHRPRQSSEIPAWRQSEADTATDEGETSSPITPDAPLRRWTAWQLFLCVVTLGIYPLLRPHSADDSSSR